MSTMAHEETLYDDDGKLEQVHDRFVRIETAAKLLSVSRSWIYANKGRLPFLVELEGGPNAGQRPGAERMDGREVRAMSTLTVAQAASRLRVHKNTIYGYIRRGTLPAKRGARGYVIDADAVKALKNGYADLTHPFNSSLEFVGAHLAGALRRASSAVEPMLIFTINLRLPPIFANAAMLKLSSCPAAKMMTTRITELFPHHAADLLPAIVEECPAFEAVLSTAAGEPIWVRARAIYVSLDEVGTGLVAARLAGDSDGR